MVSRVAARRARSRNGPFASLAASACALSARCCAPTRPRLSLSSRKDSGSALLRSGLRTSAVPAGSSTTRRARARAPTIATRGRRRSCGLRRREASSSSRASRRGSIAADGCRPAVERPPRLRAPRSAPGAARRRACANALRSSSTAARALRSSVEPRRERAVQPHRRRQRAARRRAAGSSGCRRG